VAGTKSGVILSGGAGWQVGGAQSKELLLPAVGGDAAGVGDRRQKDELPQLRSG